MIRDCKLYKINNHTLAGMSLNTSWWRWQNLLFTHYIHIQQGQRQVFMDGGMQLQASINSQGFTGSRRRDPGACRGLRGPRPLKQECLSVAFTSSTARCLSSAGLTPRQTSTEAEADMTAGPRGIRHCCACGSSNSNLVSNLESNSNLVSNLESNRNLGI